MGVLGSIGQIYMFILLALLFAGAGLAVWALINNFVSKNQVKQNNISNEKLKSPINNIKILGGFKMANNGWFKLAIFSFVGILISIAVLGFTSANGMSNMNMQSGMNGTNMGNMPMNMQSGMNGMNMSNMPMNNMNMQGGMMPTNMQSGMNGMQMGNIPMNNMNNMNMGTPNDYMMMQQQLQQMQMQLQMMQQQQQMNNNNMQQNNSSNMSGGGMSMM